MATDTQAAGDIPNPPEASEYSVVARPRGGRINPEARTAPTCMIWLTAIGLGVMVCMVLTWAIPNLGQLDWSVLFR